MTEDLHKGCVTELVGFVYRIQSAGFRRANVQAGTPGYDADGFPISTIQGTSIIPVENSFQKTNIILFSIAFYKQTYH